jgi:hypothetical protein
MPKLKTDKTQKEIVIAMIPRRDSEELKSEIRSAKLEANPNG